MIDFTSAVKTAIANNKLRFDRAANKEHHFLVDEVEAVLKRIVNESRAEATIRLFKNNGRRDDLLDKLYSEGLDENPPLEDQLDNLLGGDYCIALNYLNAWSKELRDYFCEVFVEPWIDRYGATLSGVDVYAFIGKYKSTPFGLHKDDEHTFLIGCGKNDKHAYIVEAENAKLLIKNNSSADEIYRCAEYYKLSGGDFLFIPQGVHHILSSPKYTIMIGIAPYPTSEQNLISKATKRLESLVLADKDNVEYGKDTYVFKNIISKLDYISTLYSDCISNCLAAEAKLIRSSKFLIGTPCYKWEKFTGSTEFNIIPEYQLLICEFPTESRLFANGLELIIKNKDVAEGIVNHINSGVTFSVDSININFFSNHNLKISTDIVCKLLEAGVLSDV